MPLHARHGWAMGMHRHGLDARRVSVPAAQTCRVRFACAVGTETHRARTLCHRAQSRSYRLRSGLGRSKGFALALTAASAADRMADLPSRTDPSLPMAPWLRDGFPKSLHVPIHNEIPLPGGRTLRLDTPVPAEKLAEWKERFRSGAVACTFHAGEYPRPVRLGCASLRAGSHGRGSPRARAVTMPPRRAGRSRPPSPARRSCRGPRRTRPPAPAGGWGQSSGCRGHPPRRGGRLPPGPPPAGPR